MADSVNKGGIGMAELKPMDAKVTVTLLSKNMTASVNISKPRDGGRPADAAAILSELDKSRVKAGIDQEVVNMLAADPMYDADVAVARGAYPEHGADATLVFHIEREASIRPREREDGTVDYHELGIIRHVEQDQLLAEKTPATDGTPGFDIFGNKLAAKRGRDLVLPAGLNTKASGDGLKLYAAKTGHVEFIGGKITVFDTFTVKGDVSNATGNINFNGNVVISGSVLSGFVVAATGHITVRGACEAATIRAGGNVTIGEGMNGGVLEAGGEIKAKYLQSSGILAGGNIYAGAVVNCNLRCGGSVILSGANATIAGGNCSAAKSIETINIGSKNAMVRTRVEVGLDPMVQARLAAAPKELQEVKKTLASLEQVISLLRQIEAAGRLDADKARKLSDVKFTIESEQAHQAALEEEIVQLEEKSQTLGFGTILAKGSVAAGVQIAIGPYQIELDNTTVNMRATRGEDGIRIGTVV